MPSPAFRLLTALTFFLFLASCTSVSNRIDGVERPFQPQDKPIVPIAAMTLPDHFLVEPVAGAPDAVGINISKAVAQAIVRHDVIATTLPPPQRTTRLVGTASMIRARDGTVLKIRWQVVSPTGTAPFAFSIVERLGPEETSPYETWEPAGDKARLRRIASLTADELMSWYRTQPADTAPTLQSAALDSAELNGTALTTPPMLRQAQTPPGDALPGDGAEGIKDAKALATLPEPVTDDLGPQTGIPAPVADAATESVATAGEPSEIQTASVDVPEAAPSVVALGDADAPPSDDPLGPTIPVPPALAEAPTEAPEGPPAEAKSAAAAEERSGRFGFFKRLDWRRGTEDLAAAQAPVEPPAIRPTTANAESRQIVSAKVLEPATVPPAEASLAGEAADDRLASMPLPAGKSPASDQGVAKSQPDGATVQPSALQSPKPEPAAAPQASRPAGQAPQVYVLPILGAPGDGRRSLSLAFKQALGQQGIQVVPEPGPGVFVVQSVVTLEPRSGGQEFIEIRWDMKGPRGQDLGNVKQSETIPAGSMSGAWGPVAYDVAGGAATGMADLLRAIFSAAGENRAAKPAP